MSEFAALALTYFLDRIDIFMLINVRLISFFIILPIISGSSLTNQVKLLFSVAFSFMLFIMGVVTEAPEYVNVAGFVALVVQEFFVGFTMGFVVYIFFTVIYFAGQLIDYQIGFSMVNVFDPISQIQVPVTGNLLYYFMSVLLIQSGGFHVFVSAISYSYEVIPIGRMVLLSNDNLLLYIVSLLADYFTLGIRMCLPIVGAVLLIDIALGILVKAVPQMNVFVVGMPLKLLVGVIVLFLTIPAFAEMFDTLFDISYKAMSNVIEGMSP